MRNPLSRTTVIFGTLTLGTLAMLLHGQATQAATTFSIESIGYYKGGCGTYIDNGHFYYTAILWLIFLLLFWPRQSLQQFAPTQKPWWKKTFIVLIALSFLAIGLSWFPYHHDQQTMVSSAFFQLFAHLTGARPAMALGCADLRSPVYGTLALILYPVYFVCVGFLVSLRNRLRGTPSQAVVPEPRIRATLITLIILNLLPVIAYAFLAIGATSY